MPYTAPLIKTSAQLAASLTDELGSGSVLFDNGGSLTNYSLGTPSAGTLSNCDSLPVAGLTSSTTAALGVGSIELGNANDTTIARVSAGVISVEGVTVPTLTSTSTLTNKTLTSPTLTTPALGTPASGTLTSCTGLPVAGITASTATALGVGSIELGHASDTTIARVSAGVASLEGVNIVTVSSTDTLTNKTLTAPVISAGSATAGSKMTMVNGTLLTTAEANAMENDGTAWYRTLDTTNGRTQDSNQNIFRLTANGSALGAAIADYFGSNSSLPTVTNGIYEINFYLFFLKTTAGTVTFTVTNTQTYTNLVGYLMLGPATGIASAASAGGVGLVTTTAAAAAFPASSSMTTATNQYAWIRVIAECAISGNIRLQVTNNVAGTVTPLRGSHYTARRLFAGNVGTFAA